MGAADSVLLALIAKCILRFSRAEDVVLKYLISEKKGEGVNKKAMLIWLMIFAQVCREFLFECKVNKFR